MNANKNNQLQDDALESVAGGGAASDKLIEEAKDAYELGARMMKDANGQQKAGKITKEQLQIYVNHAAEIADFANSKIGEAMKLQEQGL